MTFYDAIDKLLKTINIDIRYPIPIVMGRENSKHIDLKLFDKKDDLDVILNDKIPDYEDISVIWLDDKNNTIIQSYNYLAKLHSSDKINLTQDSLESFTFVGKTLDNKYNIYLDLPQEHIKITIDGITFIDNEIQLPDFKQFQYQNLYGYQDEDEFINAILIEFIFRNIRYNNLLYNRLKIENELLENEIDEKYDTEAIMLLEKDLNHIDDTLVQSYGLNFYEIEQFDLSLFQNTNMDNKESFSIEFNTVEPAYEDVLDLRLSENELQKKLKISKDEYEKKKKKSFMLKDKINKKYFKEAIKIINKFPKSFQKKQDDLIKSLFIFDYIQARKKKIDQLNLSVDKECENDLKEIEKYDISSSEKKIRINEINEKRDEALIGYPKMNPAKYKDSVFHDLSSLLGETPGQCKKLHSHIHKFLEKKI